MADYKFVLCDALTDTPIAEIPASAASFGEVLNGPGSATVTCHMGVDFAVQPLLQSLFIERDGVVLWGGIVWGASMDIGANTLTLNASGFWSLVRRRRLSGTLVFNGADQASIVAFVLGVVQAVPNGDMLIDLSAITPVGVTRDRTYYDYEKKNVGELVEQLADVRSGFDFAIRPAIVGGSYVRQMSLSYPATGRTTNIVLEAGVNVEVLSATIDATSMTIQVYAKGEGDGAAAVNTSLATARLLGVYPLVEDLIVYSDIKKASSLANYARRALDLGQQPMVIPTVTIYADTEPVVGTYVAGDRVRLRADYGVLQIDDTYRITEWQCSISDTAAESVALSLAPLKVFTSA